MLPRARVCSLVRSHTVLSEVKNFKNKTNYLRNKKQQQKKKPESFPGKTISNLVKSLVFRNDVEEIIL